MFKDRKMITGKNRSNLKLHMKGNREVYNMFKQHNIFCWLRQIYLQVEKLSCYVCLRYIFNKNFKGIIIMWERKFLLHELSETHNDEYTNIIHPLHTKAYRLRPNVKPGLSKWLKFPAASRISSPLLHSHISISIPILVHNDEAQKSINVLINCEFTFQQKAEAAVRQKYAFTIKTQWKNYKNNFHIFLSHSIRSHFFSAFQLCRRKVTGFL